MTELGQVILLFGTPSTSRQQIATVLTFPRVGISLRYLVARQSISLLLYIKRDKQVLQTPHIQREDYVLDM